MALVSLCVCVCCFGVCVHNKLTTTRLLAELSSPPSPLRLGGIGGPLPSIRFLESQIEW